MPRRTNKGRRRPYRNGSECRRLEKEFKQAARMDGVIL